MQDRVKVPAPVMLVGARAQVRPVVGDTDAVRLTTPAKPCSEVIVMVDVPAEPALSATEVGLAIIVKSWTV